MNTLDIFNNNAFSVVEMTKAISVIPNMYGRLNELKLFPGEGIATTSVNLEIENQVLSLVPQGTRGGRSTQGGDRSRILKSFNIPHFPLNNRVTADEIQGVRAFGTPDQLEGVMEVTMRKLRQDRQRHALTLEFLRNAALNGQIIGPGGELILDLFAEFGTTQLVVNFDLDTDSSDVNGAIKSVVRHIEDNLLGDVMSYVHCLCGPTFFDKLVDHPKIVAAYQFYASTNNPNRVDPRKGFPHQGVIFEEYRGTATLLNEDGTSTVRRFVQDDEAHFFPMGTQSTFKTFFAPANWMETVNTRGRPVYAKIGKDGSGENTHVPLFTQSNPLPLCMRPALLVKGTDN